MPKRAFHRNCLTGWGGWPHSSKTQFSEKLVFERTCASTSKHFLHPIFFFLTWEVSIPPTVKEPLVNSCLGAQPLLILACAIMQMQHWCSHSLGRDPIPASHSIQQLPTAWALPPLKTAAFVCTSVLIWVLPASVTGCTCCCSVLQSLSLLQFSNAIKH